VGLAALVGAGDALVKGAVALSLRLGLSPLFVGLTVVGFGTSAPELLVNVKAALTDADAIAFGNIVGSNVCNVLLVLGLPALIAPIDPAGFDTRRSWVTMMAASLLFIVLAFLGPLTWWHGLILLAGLGWMLADQFRDARRAAAAKSEAELLAEIEDADPSMPGWKIAAFLGAGLVGLPLGAHFLIEGARGIALSFGVGEAAIGLTLVAIGTSLPELITSVMAAIKRHSEVALGNVIGSNMFNLLGIMGVTSLVSPLTPPPEFLAFDFWFMLATSALLWVAVYPQRVIGRIEGSALLLIYGGYAYVALATRL